MRKSPLIFVILLVNLLANVDGQGCYNSGNSSSNSTYRYNINTLLHNLSVNIGDNGFYNASLGQNTDTVYANALCRGDIQLETCRTCVRYASDFLLQSCPNNRQSRWVDGYLCHVRYSNVSQFGVLDTSGDLFSERDTQNAMDPELFRSDLTNLLNELWRRASNGGTLRKVAAGNTTTSNSRVIFAMVQCTPDLSQQDCESCLIATAQRLPRCCGYSQRAGAYTRSCFLRYQITPFYNETRLQELETVVPSSLPSPQPTQAGNRTTTIIIVVVSVAAGLIIIAVLVCSYIMKMRRTPKEETEMGEVIDDMSIVESLQYDFGVIKVATNDFSDDNKLGQGGFGSVYKGKLPTGQEIAVKRLSRGSGQGDLEFKNEVVLLVKLQHRNLVRLLGFSLEGSEKLLMYELVQNASLDAFIFDPIKRLLLDWDKRYKIIGGIARGILYLHEDSRLRIIHRDLKASNILLDGEMNPKIADFGMARIFVPDETHASTSRIVGTYGYMSPEYAMRGQFSVKSDVFSFGVLLLEIISGQRNSCFQHDGTQVSLINSAWKNWRERTTSSLVDPVLIVNSSMPSDILRCIHIGLLCVQENAADRPTMASVIIMLNSLSINLPVPSHPGFYVHEGTESTTSQNEMSQSEMSQSEMSVTEFHGR